MSDARLTFQTLALRRELASDHCELAPVAAPQLAAYGSEGQTTAELQLALAELADEARPTTVARFLLPDGVRLEEVELPIGRPELPGRLSAATGIPIALLADARSLALADVIAALRRRMVDQDAAVRRVAEAICVAKAGAGRQAARVAAVRRAVGSRQDRARALGSRLAQLGHDPRLGARPLRRTIEDLVVAPIAERIAREPTWRDPTVRITTSEERGDIRVG